MKIYEIGTGYTPIPAIMGAATEIVVEELTKSFYNKKKDVTIIDIKSDNRVKTDLPIIEVSVPKKFTGTDTQLGIMHKLKRVVYSISLAKTLRSILKKSKYKVVFHFHNQYNLFFFLKLTSESLRRKCFIAYTNHSYIWHGEWNEIKDTVNKRYFQEIYSMKHADRVYVLNEKTKETLIKYIGLDSQKVQMIDNGVNIDVYSPMDEADVDAFKYKCGLEGKKVFLQIGSVCDRKNQLGAIELLLPLLKENKDSVFVYAGGIISEEYQNEIIGFSKKNGIGEQVKYMGELKPGAELNKYYNLADVMVFPSKSEGFSLVIIESMAAGVPVIINEKLEFRLADKCLKYTNESDFIATLKDNILDDEKRIELAKEVRQAVVENYSWDKIAKDYFNSWKK